MLGIAPWYWAHWQGLWYGEFYQLFWWDFVLILGLLVSNTLVKGLVPLICLKTSFNNEILLLRGAIHLFRCYIDHLHVLFRFNADESWDLIHRYLLANPDPNNNNVQQEQAQLAKEVPNEHHVNVGWAVFWNVTQECRLWEDSIFPSIARGKRNELHERFCLFLMMVGFRLRPSLLFKWFYSSVTSDVQ